MKIVYIGCVEFSKNALEKLIDLNAEIVGIITKEESTFNSDFCNLSVIADFHNIPKKK